MNWVDIVVLILIGCMAATEAKRGFGIALFTLAGAFFSLELALIWSGPFSKALRLLAQPGPNKALALGIIFIGLMLAFTLVILLLHPDTFLSLEPFDNLLGAICGIASGWILAYVFLTGWGSGARKIWCRARCLPRRFSISRPTGASWLRCAVWVMCRKANITIKKTQEAGE